MANSSLLVCFLLWSLYFAANCSRFSVAKWTFQWQDLRLDHEESPLWHTVHLNLQKKTKKKRWQERMSNFTSFGQTSTIHAFCLKISFEIRIITTNCVLLCEQLLTPPPHFMWHWRWLSLRLSKYLWVALYSPEKSRPVPYKSEFSSTLVIWHIIVMSRDPYSLVIKCMHNDIGGPYQQQEQQKNKQANWQPLWFQQLNPT